MFGASPNPFGQGSGSSPFGSQSVFGQTSSSPANPFANKPFGSPAATSSPFAPQPGGSIFGGTSTGMFGTPQTSSPFSSTPAFGAASSPAFGSSFGATPSTPAFGSGGGSSAFGQKPVFGGFGSNTQANPFGSTSQQSQPAFGGSGMFGSTPAFGAPSQSAFGTPTAPAFGSTSTPSFGSGGTTAFGASSTPAFGASSTPAFGASSTPAFGATNTSAFGATSTPAFGSSAFGSTGSGFGLSNTPVFGSVGAFGASNTGSAFGSSSTPAFGATASAFGTPTASAFGASSSPAFGASGTSQFNFSSSPTFGQSTSTFGSTPFGSTTSAFGAQNSTFGSQATQPFGSPGFAQPGFAGARGGTRVANYTPTTETDTGTQPAGKLESIAAMPVYKDKSHEELRWEDYQSGDKGGPAPLGQSSGGIAFSTTPPQSNAFSTSSQFGQTSASNLFNQNKSPFGNSSPSVFAPPSNPFSTASPFSSASTSTFSNTSLFGTGTSSTPASAPSLFSSSTPQQSSPFGSTLTFNNPQTSLSASTPTFGQTGNLFGQSTPAPAFGSSSLFSGTPASTGGNFFSSTSSLSTNVGAFSQPTQSMQPFGQTTPSAPFNFANMSQTQTAFPSGFAGSPGFGQFNSGQMSSAQGVQQVPITNPFGTLPAMPQLSIGQVGTSSNVQYGISSMPVVNKPAPVRISSLLTPRHISQQRIRLAARKYHPGPKVPFFTDEEETPSTPKADALFIPRENPRALVIRPSDQWLPRTGFKVSPMKADPSAGIYENAAEDDIVNNSRHNQKSDSVENSEQTLSGHRAGEAAIVYEHGADIEALMPKLRLSDYYTEPRLQELAAKERAEPGFCRHVKDFVVGRKGYGSIKFLGETDVRRLDLESLVQFNNREVIVYMDDNKKPSIGQGLNKPAEVTLLNIKCFDKKTGCQYTEGPKIEKYKEMLKRKAEDQGAEFISYNPVKGEWKFKVNHF